ncbi:MAG TPA: cytidylate kinase-like family protein [Candidatus Cryptobacteroides merdipullorum]|uniref:Cytidylate kinase-like family protein n=1 Tax=Candidatus Cryptobacteroides merdipullorum TaxID=2840771 RepID=A0A9D1GQ12_9BACT|nr:cytidylate kinase-like family protein [Candidatus Cryptobacteroides merdipullorum]
MENRIIINIGRQFGSGGRTVASIIGDKLGVEVYDNELILKAAERSGVKPEFFRHNDEKKRFFTFGYSQNAINDEGLFKIQSDTIRGIAESGSAIFVGRAADYVLRDMKCLDVFVCAPFEWRRDLVSERAKMSPEDAAKLIQKKDKSRESWYNFFTFGNWGVASNYDLCLDSSILGLEGTADFIIDFARRAGLL